METFTLILTLAEITSLREIVTSKLGVTFDSVQTAASLQNKILSAKPNPISAPLKSA